MDSRWIVLGIVFVIGTLFSYTKIENADNKFYRILIATQGGLLAVVGLFMILYVLSGECFHDPILLGD